MLQVVDTIDDLLRVFFGLLESCLSMADWTGSIDSVFAVVWLPAYLLGVGTFAHGFVYVV